MAIRQRFPRNRGLVASSDVKRLQEYRADLYKNHIENQALFLAISEQVTIKPKSSLELFEEGLKSQLREFKIKRKKCKS